MPPANKENKSKDISDKNTEDTILMRGGSISGFEKTRKKTEAKAQDISVSVKESPEPQVPGKKPRVPVNPLSEKEEFISRLTRFDDEDEEENDEEEIIRIRANISGNSKPKNPLLERDASPQKKQGKFLNGLIIKLNEAAPKSIDRDEIDSIIEKENDVHEKIRNILDKTDAKKIKSLQKKSDLFEMIFDYLDESFKREKREIQKEIMEQDDLNNAEKQYLINQKLKELESKYDFREILDKYLDLDFQMTDKEKKTYSDLYDKLKDSGKLSDEELSTFRELQEKSRTAQKWEEI